MRLPGRRRCRTTFTAARLLRFLPRRAHLARLARARADVRHSGQSFRGHCVRSVVCEAAGGTGKAFHALAHDESHCPRPPSLQPCVA